MKHFIDGKNIYLREFTKDDIPVWYSFFNDANITEYMNKGAFPNTYAVQEDHLTYLSKSKNDVQLAVVLKKNDMLIGIVGIHKIDWIHRHGDVSIVIGNQAQWGKGIATEAISLIVKHGFTKLNLHKLTAGMWASNIDAKRCFEKVGFIEEGKIREQFFYKNNYVDEYRLGLLRKDWETRSER